MFVFSLNKDVEAGFGQAMFLLTLQNPHLEYYHYSHFEATDGSYMNLIPFTGKSMTPSATKFQNNRFEINRECIKNVDLI